MSDGWAVPGSSGYPAIGCDSPSLDPWLLRETFHSGSAWGCDCDGTGWSERDVRAYVRA